MRRPPVPIPVARPRRRGSGLARAVLAGAALLSALASSAPALAIRRSDVLNDAQSWVDAGVPYSQGVWGSYCSWDYCYADPLRGGACYRADCSGFVSATWGLEAPGRNTWGLCDGTVATEIAFDSLQPGDALVKCNQHAMLFRQWIDGDTFEAYEEYTCGATAELRRHSAASLQGNGYIALRYDAIEDDPPPNAPPTGWLDSVGCTVTGWAQDPDAPEVSLGVHVTVGGPAEDPSAVALDLGPADRERADLCAAIGSCNHGFDLELPPAFRDGTQRAFYAYSFDASEGWPALLSGSPATGSCGRMTPPVPPVDGVKRWVPSSASFDAWRWSALDVAPLEDATVADYPDGPSLPDAPVAVRADDGSPEVWVLDGAVRRHVVDADSLAAWRLEGEVQLRAAQAVYEHEEGLDWPDEPFVFRGSGPEVYVIDFAEPDEIGAGDPDAESGWRDDALAPGYAGGDRATGAGAPGGLSGGCAVATAPASQPRTGPWALAPLIAALLVLRRRRG